MAEVFSRQAYAWPYRRGEAAAADLAEDPVVQGPLQREAKSVPG